MKTEQALYIPWYCYRILFSIDTNHIPRFHFCHLQSFQRARNLPAFGIQFYFHQTLEWLKVFQHCKIQDCFHKF